MDGLIGLIIYRRVRRHPGSRRPGLRSGGCM